MYTTPTLTRIVVTFDVIGKQSVSCTMSSIHQITRTFAMGSFGILFGSTHQGGEAVLLKPARETRSLGTCI